MIAVIQRVTSAAVRVDGEAIGRIGPGLLVLAAVCKQDEPADAQWVAKKLAGLRLFRSGEKNFDVDVRAVGGAILVVSNFTVAGSTARGRRPSFDDAADAATGRPLIDALVDALRTEGVVVETGRFGADMKVELVNDGPVTLMVNSADAPQRDSSSARREEDGG